MSRLIKGKQIDGIFDGVTATTIGDSGTCVSDLYVSNIHSCSPLLINPLDEGDVYMGSNSGFTYDSVNERVGVGNTTPTAKLHVQSAGSTNATNALLVENSSGTDILTVQDDGLVQINTTTTSTSYAGAIDGLNLLANIGDTNRAAAAFSTEYNPTANNSNFIRSIATRTNKLGTFNTSHVIGVGAEARNSSTGSVGDLVGVDALTWVTGNATITRAFAVDANAQAQSGTITDFGSIRLTLGQSTAGATITNMYGIKIESPTNTGAAVTNTYGIRINSNTTGTNNWGIYQVGSTVNNYFDGNVGIGTDDPNDNLQVGTTGATATFRYVDGNQADGYVLTSDANGVATWMSGATGGGGTSKYAASVPMTGGTAVTVTHSLGTTDVVVQVKNPSGELITAGVVDNYLSNSVDIEVSITGTYRVIVIG